MSSGCQEFRERAAAAALGALEGPELGRFQRHLAGCPSCHAEFERSRRALELAASGASAQPVPAMLATRVLASGREELAREARVRFLRGRILPAAAAAAALALAAGLAWHALRMDAGPAPADGCWRFVDGDSGNARRAELAPGLVPDRVAWEQRLKGVPGNFKPLAWGNLVVVGAMPSGRPARGGEGGRLAAFDARDGRALWERDFPSGTFDKGKNFPDRCVVDGRVYVTDGQACLVMDAATGRDLGRIEPPAGAQGWSYLTAAEGRLFGAARDGRAVFALDPRSGRELWSRATEAPVFVPAVCDGRVCFATGAGDLAALDARTGEPLWRRQRAVPAGSATVHAMGGAILVAARSDELLAFDAADGRPAWRRHEAGVFASGLAFGDDAVFLRGGTLALRLSDGGTLWQQSGAAGSLCAAPTVAGSRVLATAGASAGSLSALEGESGRSLAALADAAVRSCDGAIVAGGRIFTVTDGRLMAVACRSKG